MEPSHSQTRKTTSDLNKKQENRKEEENNTLFHPWSPPKLREKFFPAVRSKNNPQHTLFISIHLISILQNRPLFRPHLACVFFFLFFFLVSSLVCCSFLFPLPNHDQDSFLSCSFGRPFPLLSPLFLPNRNP